MFAYTVLVGFADAVTVAEDSIQEHSRPQIVSRYFFRYRGRFLKLHINIYAKCVFEVSRMHRWNVFSGVHSILRHFLAPY